MAPTPMDLAESQNVLLRRLWADTWDAARFAAERPLHKPAFSLDACGPQLELAAQGVVWLREAIAGGSDVAGLLPLEGRSRSLLEQAVDTGKGMPDPVEDPAGFVRALLHAALQTGDGGYGLGLAGEAAVDAMIQRHCGELLDAARDLHNPTAAVKDLMAANAEFSSALQVLDVNTIQDGSKEAAVRLSGRLLQLGREVRDLASQVQELAVSGVQGSSRDTDMGEAEPSTNMDVSGAPEQAPAFAQLDPGSEASGGDDEAAALERTKSQVVKRIKVNEVAQVVEARREPVQQLRRMLSQLDGRPSEAPQEAGGAALRYERTAEQLKQVQKLQQNLRNFGEDLMEGMLTLDQLSDLAEEDRKVRKDTFKGIQGLLDEIDSAKPRVAKLTKKLVGELDELKTAAQAEQQPAAQEAPAGAPPAVQQQHEPRDQPPPQTSRQHQAPTPLATPRVDWTQLKLPLKFSTVERPQAYMLSASVAGLDPESIQLQRKGAGILSVQGARLPSAAEERALLRQLSEHIQGMPWERRRSLTQEDAAEMMLQLGHGRYGRFIQEFQLPRDTDVRSIQPSYEDGVLRIVLPRLVPQHARQPGGWTGDVPDGYSNMRPSYLW